MAHRQPPEEVWERMDPKLKYVYETTTTSERIIKALTNMGVDHVTDLLVVQSSDINSAYENKEIKTIDVGKANLLISYVMKACMHYNVTDEQDLTTENTKEYFKQGEYRGYNCESSKARSVCKNESNQEEKKFEYIHCDNQSSIGGKTKGIRPEYKITDYCEFSGVKSLWQQWKNQVMPMLEAEGLSEVLDKHSVEAHTILLETDETYKYKNIEVHRILLNRTANNCTHIINSVSKMKDGRLLWDTLLHHYEKTGDRSRNIGDRYITIFTMRMDRLTLPTFEAYQKAMEKEFTALDDAGHVLVDEAKCAAVRMAITDPQYKYMFDIYKTANYKVLMDEFHRKAMDINSGEGTVEIRRSNAVETKPNPPVSIPTTFANNSGNTGGNNQKIHPDRELIPVEVWAMLSMREKHFFRTGRTQAREEYKRRQHGDGQFTKDKEHTKREREDGMDGEYNKDPKSRQHGPSSFFSNTRKSNVHRTIRQNQIRVSLEGTRADNLHDHAIIDSGCDTTSVGGPAWHIECIQDSTVTVVGFHPSMTKIDIPVGTAITAVDLPDGSIVLLRVHEASIHDTKGSTLLSTTQLRDCGIKVEDKAKRHGGRAYILADNTILPLRLIDGLLALKIRLPTEQELETIPTIELTSKEKWDPSITTEVEISANEYEILKSENDKRESVAMLTKTSRCDCTISEIKPFFLYAEDKTLEKTIKATTRLGAVYTRFPLRTHIKSRNPLLQRRRFKEPYATDTWFSTTKSYEGYKCAQIFVGIQSKMVSHYGMTTESDGPNALLDFLRKEGVPLSILKDNSKMQSGKIWQEICRRYWIKDEFTEPYHPHQNHAERLMAKMKAMMDRLYITTGCAPEAWFRAACHVADIHNCTASNLLKNRTPIEHRDGETPDISALLTQKFWDPVYYKVQAGSFPREGGMEKLGRWLGRAEEYGDGMSAWILDIETNSLVIRSAFRGATTGPPNQALDIQLQQSLCENTENPVARITVNSDQAKGSKNIPQVNFDTQYIGDVVEKDNDKRRIEDMEEERELDDDMHTVMTAHTRQSVKPAEDKEDREWGIMSISNHKTNKEPPRKNKVELLVEWKDGSEATWEHLESVARENLEMVVRYGEHNNLMKYKEWKWINEYEKERKSNKAASRRRILKAVLQIRMKYQFGFRLPKNVREAYLIDLEYKTEKWAEAIRKEIETLLDKQCFRILEAGEAPPKGYFKIPLLWIFAVKHDGRHRARCVGGGHVTPNLTMDMYSGSVALESVRVVFVIAAKTGLLLWMGDVSSAYIEATTTEKVFTIAGQEFGELEGRVLIVDKALYGLKSSGARWHMKLAESLRCMGFLPCKADYDLWIRWKEDHYEYMAVVVDDLLIFSKAPKEITDELTTRYEYELKGVGIPEYYNGADMKIEGSHWTMGSEKYVHGVVKKIEEMVGSTIREYSAPMESNDHPELDESEYVSNDDRVCTMGGDTGPI
jgi:Reverse transcriptase (RNA-dependent DNA polymerase)